MTPFHLFDTDTAPEGSRPALRNLQQTFGFVPNIAAAMAASPPLIEGFAGVFRNVHSGSFGEAQIQVLLLTNAVTNACPWAVAFHSHLAGQLGVAPADVASIREGRLPAGASDAALSAFARRLIERRGQVGEADLATFLAAGFERAQALEVILVVAASTITNYVGNVAQPPLEEAFRPQAWVAANR